MSGVYTLGVEVASHKVYDADRTRTALDSLTVDGRRWVAIDPEDREQVERLCVAYVQRHNYAGVPWDDREQRNRDLVVDSLAAALREFANPVVRPDEPRGLGAVVEDADGFRWIRQGGDRLGAPWYRRNSPGRPEHRAWHEVAAVRVLSEGWSE